MNAIQIAAFLKRRWAGCRGWPRAKIVPWVAWFVHHDRALVLTDERGRIAGVALGRFCHTVTQALAEPMQDTQGGQVCWIDVIAIRPPAAVPQMLRCLAEHWGDRAYVAGKCFVRGGELRVFPMARVRRFFTTPQGA
jgi:hypothetical protein